MNTNHNKYRPRSVATNAGWNALSTTCSISISFVLTPILIYKLGVYEYGVLLLIWSITGMLGITDFGLGEAVLRYAARYNAKNDIESINRVFTSTLTIYMLICLIVVIGLNFAAPQLIDLLNLKESDQKLGIRLLRLALFVYTIILIANAFKTIPMALHRYDISSKINLINNFARFFGYIILVTLNYEIQHILMWDIFTNLCILLLQVIVARHLLPGLDVFPSFSIKGLHEIIGYSAFSFLTYIFYTLQREAGKLSIGTILGPSPVAYFGTPDNVAQRIYSVVTSGGETLLPKFSNENTQEVVKRLYINGTWASLVIMTVLFVPLIALLPDFLRLWITPEFANKSATVGQLVAISYIAQGAFTPTGTFFRGTGRPWFVTIVVATSVVTILITCFILVPKVGIVGVGIAYILGSISPLIGLITGWFYILGWSSFGLFIRCMFLPIMLGIASYKSVGYILHYFREPDWLQFIIVGVISVSFMGILVFSIDWMIGGSSPAKYVIKKTYSLRIINNIVTHSIIKKVVVFLFYKKE